jgi:hypothetical protein
MPLITPIEKALLRFGKEYAKADNDWNIERSEKRKAKLLKWIAKKILERISG